MTHPMRTLAEVRADLDRNDRDWSAAARRQMLNAVDRLARLTGKNLADLPGDETALIAIVDGHLSWRKDGFTSAAAFRDFRGRLARAARETGRPRLLRFTPGDAWLPAWRALLDAIDAAVKQGAEKPWSRRAIAHLAGYANSRGLTPAEVDSDVLAELLAEHARTKKVTDAAELRAVDYARKAIDSARAWNRLVREKNDKPWLRHLPATILEWDGRARIVNPPLTAYPRDFQADIAAYLASLAKSDRADMAADPDDPFGSVPADLASYDAWEAAHGEPVAMTDVHTPEETSTPRRKRKRDAPLSEATIANHRQAIRQLAGAVVRRGVRRVDEIRRLRDVCTYPGLHAALNDYVNRQKAKPDAKLRAETASAYQLAETIASIAERWCGAPADYVRQMRKLQAMAKTASCGAMSVNRQAQLRQFDEPWAMLAWLDHPVQLFDAAEQRRKSGKPLRAQDIADVEVALLCRLLMILPARRANVVTLRYGGDQPTLQLRRHAAEKSWLFWRPHETKNRRYLRAEIDIRSERMIRTYLEHWRPRYLALTGTPDSDALFPGHCGSERRGLGHRHPGALGRALTERMRRAGLHMSMHLARHLAAKIMVNADPRLVATAAELLAITEATARAYYLDNRSQQASAALRAIVERRLPEIRREWLDTVAA